MENKLKTISIFSLVVFLFLFNGCCDKIAIFDLAKTKFFEQTIALKKGDVITFWTAIEADFKEEPLMVYSFKFFEGNQQLFEGGINPFNLSLKEEQLVKKRNDKTNLNLKGKLEGNFKPKKDGVYTIKVHLIKNNSPNFILHKAKVTFFKS